MLALHLVALGRPGWFVPNSADAVRTKALLQEENLSEKLLFRKLVWWGARLEAFREGIEAKTEFPTCEHCNAVLNSERRRQAHALTTPGSKGRTGWQKLWE